MNGVAQCWPGSSRGRLRPPATLTSSQQWLGPSDPEALPVASQSPRPFDAWSSNSSGMPVASYGTWIAAHRHCPTPADCSMTLGSALKDQSNSIKEDDYGC